MDPDAGTPRIDHARTLALDNAFNFERIVIDLNHVDDPSSLPISATEERHLDENASTRRLP